MLARWFFAAILLLPAMTSGAAQQPQSETRYDPYLAYHDVEVGNFYMRKGDLDAAIERFEDAIRARPDFAKPRLLLAEAHEKKGDLAAALKYYREYLQVFPGAPDAKKVRKKIDQLVQQSAKKTSPR